MRRSWTELLRTLHSGVALLGTNGCVEYATDRFLGHVGLRNEDVADVDIRQLFYELGDGDPRGLYDRVVEGTPTKLIHRFVSTRDGQARWARITIVPNADLGAGLAAVLFAQDTSARSITMAARRHEMLRLTAVEDEEARRVSQELHAGPIPLLAGLQRRLSSLEGSVAVSQLSDFVADVTAQLDDAVREFSAEPAGSSAAESLERWMSPLLVGSEIDMRIDDHMDEQPNAAVVQAIFVFIYELVRSLRYLGRRRDVRITLSNERGGFAISKRWTPIDGPEVLQGRTAAQLRSAFEYTRSLGGTILDELDGHDARVFRIWLPPIEDRPDDEPVTIPEQSESSLLAPSRWVLTPSGKPPTEMSDEVWNDVTQAAPEPVIEFDPGRRFANVNRAYENVTGFNGSQLYGRTMEEVFPDSNIRQLSPEIAAKMMVGETYQGRWNRKNAHGEMRFVDVAMSPRFDDVGAFLGAMCSIEDFSDMHFLESLHTTAMADLRHARRQAARHSIQHLRRPIAAMEDLVERIRDFEDSTTDVEAFRSIRLSLDEIIPRALQSLALIDVPELAEDDLGSAIRESLGALLLDVDLDYVNRLLQPLSPEHAETFFRIGREAAINAVLHGRATTILLTLSTRPNGISMDVIDDGIGITPEGLESADDHVGLRAMSNRAEALGGRCWVSAASDGGTRVAAWLPHDAGGAQPTAQT